MRVGLGVLVAAALVFSAFWWLRDPQVNPPLQRTVWRSAPVPSSAARRVLTRRCGESRELVSGADSRAPGLAELCLDDRGSGDIVAILIVRGDHRIRCDDPLECMVVSIDGRAPAAIAVSRLGNPSNMVVSELWPTISAADGTKLASASERGRWIQSFMTSQTVTFEPMLAEEGFTPLTFEMKGARA